ncbi:MAG: hypothetical protein FJ128_06110 [Deltaproteobacteria bacterium]|nr:hypothetical protein [Deltaproteobacteria bacterium]
MTAREDDEPRDRPSWRDIDRRRERPGEKSARAPRPARKQAEWVRKMALRQAEALFKGKKGRPEYQTALKGLEAAYGTKKFPAEGRKFLEEYGLPDEWGALNLLLDYPEPEVVLQAMEAMARQAASRSRVERQGFQGRLKIWALTSDDPAMRQRAEEILEKL